MYFVSDNNAGAHPAVLAALAAANDGHAHSYGADPVTEHAGALFKRHFGEHAETVFAVTGTAANVIALAAMLRPYDTALCADSAHVFTDECGAPERLVGARLTAVPTADGRLTPAQVVAFAASPYRPHGARPRAVTVAQPTELGTVYSAAELRALAETAHAYGLLLHVDGARLANAAAALGTGLGELAEGADVVSFGGTKNGALAADAVVFLDPGLAADRALLQKQSMQLLAKARFTAAQFVALLDGDLWRTNAASANATAARLAGIVSALPGVKLAYPVQTNAVFAHLPEPALAALEGYGSRWGPGTLVRFMTAFDTTAVDVDRFATVLHAAFTR
ncbi:beta-eliminating lyase-related protein [Dactylosporangium sp. NPDC051485]|uniref:threonine aldolase family protein n=1 Tax=Dactylosporangium sp. NPDC051485 TaxID=3154846 RepID=UPI00344A17F8